MNAMDITVLLIMHYLVEAETMCEIIAIINRGWLINCEKMSGLFSQLGSKEITFTLNYKLELIQKLLDAYQVNLIKRPRLKFCYASSKVTSVEILSAISDAGRTIADISTKAIELGGIFVKLTKGRTSYQ
jgi:ABC-2 type transport system ATP-binding protein